ncbi:hypothetical protein EG68_09436 [Paragonimus skrjabini miyazakii]|uniref:Uncharacterized protein n=1 Tax=Paragonimus skrjabini miyazakii TaxID=59628 RepID=A0A8S9YTA8_9TREM|nr:hypothetical protein EG68_09436 [Paragonimus skrjabini miyazakii]
MLRVFARKWFVGHGASGIIRPAEEAGYQTDPVSGTLLLYSFDNQRHPPDTFTCLLSPELNSNDDINNKDKQNNTNSNVKYSNKHQKPSFVQSHHVLTDRRIPDYPPSRDYVSDAVEVHLELITHVSETEVPGCRHYPRVGYIQQCPEAFWSNITRRSNFPQGYYHYLNQRLQYDPTEHMIRSINQTAKSFCKTYRCTVNGVTIHAKESNEDYRSWINRKSTHTVPGNEVLNISVTLSFRAKQFEHIRGQRMRQLFEPSLGDGQDDYYWLALEHEPYALFNRLLLPYEMSWIRTSETTDAEKYRPVVCADKPVWKDVQRNKRSTKEYTSAWTLHWLLELFPDPLPPTWAYLIPWSGFTVIFQAAKGKHSEVNLIFDENESEYCSIKAECDNQEECMVRLVYNF